MLIFHEITDLNDDYLLPWLDIYEMSFPPRERELVSDQLALIKDRESRLSEDEHFLAAVDDEGEVAAIIRYRMISELRAVGLWYLAVAPDARGSGIGSACYVEIVRRAQENNALAIVMEVERPEDQHEPELRRLAERRIEFYRRHGAGLLQGIEYWMYVGPHQPETLMHILIHPLEPIDVEEAYEIVRKEFGESVSRVGELSLI